MTTINLLNLENHAIHFYAPYPYFSLAHQTNDEIFLDREFAHCREYIGQGIYDKKTKKITCPDSKKLSPKFSFKTGPTLIPIYFKGIENRKEYLKKHLKWLHKWETQAGVSHSEILDTQNPDVLVIKGDQKWKDSCWKITLYTFLIKSCCYYRKGNCNKDYWPFLNREHNIDKLLSNINMHWEKEIFDTEVYGPELKTNTRANNGFLTILQGKNPQMAKLLAVTAPTLTKNYFGWYA